MEMITFIQLLTIKPMTSVKEKTLKIFTKKEEKYLYADPLFLLHER